MSRSAVFALLAVLASGCTQVPEWSTGSKIHYPPKARAASPQPGMLVSSDWLAQNINRGDLVIVHVASDRAVYDRGHIPGAHFVALADVCGQRCGLPDEVPSVAQLAQVVARLGLEKRDHMIVYDEQEGLMAARFYVAMDYIGLGEQTSMLDGQFRRWQADNRPLSTDKVRAGESDIVPTVRPQVVLTLEAQKDAVALARETPRCAWQWWTRGPEEFTGQRAGDGIQRPGHIPGAINVPWTSNIRSLANPVLLSMEELRRLYAQNGVMPEDFTVTYCRTGTQAAFSYFVLKYLGYNVTLYNGSYWQWSRAAELPVEMK